MQQMLRFLALLALAGLSNARAGRPLGADQLLIKPELSKLFPRPAPEEHAHMARWLVHSTSYGTLATINGQGMPVGGIVSHADGEDATGRIFFYLTPMDELVQNFLENPQCSYTVTEAQRYSSATCHGTDPESPLCARITALGRMQPVPEPDVDRAREAMYAAHPEMADWPMDHKFAFFELQVAEVHLLDAFGGMKYITRDEYYSADLRAASRSIDH